MKDKIKLVIFDMDGLMVDTESICIKAWDRVFNRYNIKVTKDFYFEIIGSSAKVLEEKIKEKNILKDNLIFEDILNAQRQEAASIVETEGIEKKKGIDELLEYLEKKGIKKAVASSSFRKKVDNFLDKVELKNKFDYIIAGDEVKNSKPAPDLYLDVIKKFGISNKNIMILEDSKNGLTAAKNAGIIKRVYIPDIVILSPKEEEELTYRKFTSLLEVKRELEESRDIF
ncbi:MAG: HAD family phosphatase [Fusobacterium mortiferum]|nr:HAD family phosphatase [uncultured Fusobacterium sp.]MCI7187793.1 HAD family phosphatase [Fusobacterium mortiferum]MDY2800323.1 HAD family phosphatase [Fusobacterium mortiferum]